MGIFISAERKAEIEEIKRLELRIEDFKSERKKMLHQCLRWQQSETITTPRTQNELLQQKSAALERRVNVIHMLAEAEKELITTAALRQARLRMKFKYLRLWFGLETSFSQIVAFGGMCYITCHGMHELAEGFIIGDYLKAVDPEMKEYHAYCAMEARSRKRNYFTETIHKTPEFLLRRRSTLCKIRGAAILSVPVGVVVYSCYKYAETLASRWSTVTSTGTAEQKDGQE